MKGIFKLGSIVIAFTAFLVACGGGGDSSAPKSKALSIQYFFANDGVNGTELWKTDGTQSGTTMVKDINPTGDSSVSGRFLDVKLGNYYYFFADNGVDGIELWKTDGTEAGTVMVKDINPSGDFSYYGSSRPVVIGKYMYFAANDGKNGEELWRSDGTKEGTVIVADINSGSGSSYPIWITEYNSELFFRAQTSAAGSGELYKYNPATDSVSLVKNTNTGSINNGSGQPQSFVVSDNRLFFVAYDTSASQEVWVSDGTTSGTKLLADISSSGGSYPTFLTETSIGLFFAADSTSSGLNRQLYYVKNGAQNPVLVKRINSNGGSLYDLSGYTGSCAPSFAEFKNHIYFFANDGASGFELWRTDGTSNNTTKVKDINVGVSSSCMNSTYYDVTIVSNSNALLFSAQSSSNDVELWKSDGTSEGTVLVKDINMSGSSSPENFRVVGDIIYFFANNGVNGKELWRTDGTSSGTYMIKDINMGSSGSM